MTAQPYSNRLKVLLYVHAMRLTAEEKNALADAAVIQHQSRNFAFVDWADELVMHADTLIANFPAALPSIESAISNLSFAPLSSKRKQAWFELVSEKPLLKTTVCMWLELAEADVTPVIYANHPHAHVIMRLMKDDADFKDAWEKSAPTPLPAPAPTQPAPAPQPAPQPATEDIYVFEPELELVPEEAPESEPEPELELVLEEAPEPAPEFESEPTSGMADRLAREVQDLKSALKRSNRLNIILGALLALSFSCCGCYVVWSFIKQIMLGG